MKWVFAGVAPLAAVDERRERPLWGLAARALKLSINPDEAVGTMLPTPEALAGLVSRVTETMFATSFAPDEPHQRGDSLCGQMVMLPLLGERDIRLVLAFDRNASMALASGLFRVPAQDLSADMIDDAIRELLNMVAGQISSALQLDQALGLPRPTTLAELADHGGVKREEAVLLRSQGRVDLRLWILEKAVVKTEQPKGRFRSLLHRISSAVAAPKSTGS